MKFFIHIAAICLLGQGNVKAIERFDYHIVRKQPSAAMSEIYEGEFLSESLNCASQFKLNEECEAISLMIDINGDGEITDWNFITSIIKPVNVVTSKHLKAINNRKSTSKSIHGGQVHS